MFFDYLDRFKTTKAFKIGREFCKKQRNFYSNYWHFLKEFDDTSDGSIDELKF